MCGTHGGECVETRLEVGQRSLQRGGKPRVLALRECVERQTARPSAQRQRFVARARSRGA
jgi:hypothetical protein